MTVNRSFDEAWASITSVPPIARQLERAIGHRWARFDSLPEGIEFAQTPEEYEEVVARNEQLIWATVGEPKELLLVTGLLGDPKAPDSLSDAQLTVHHNPEYWREQEDEMESPLVIHLWASWENYSSRPLSPLIELASADLWENEDWLRYVLLIDPTNRVAIHPGPEGIDVFLPSVEERDALRASFEEWAHHCSPESGCLTSTQFDERFRQALDHAKAINAQQELDNDEQTE